MNQVVVAEQVETLWSAGGKVPVRRRHETMQEGRLLMVGTTTVSAAWNRT
jgi:hypothetical protein